MLLEQDVGISQVLDVLVAALQLLLQPTKPLLHIRQALVKKLRAVGVEQKPGFLLGGGLQLVPQLVEFGQAVLHDGLKLRLGLHERLTLLRSKRHGERRKYQLVYVKQRWTKESIKSKEERSFLC